MSYSEFPLTSPSTLPPPTTPYYDTTCTFHQLHGRKFMHMCLWCANTHIFIVFFGISLYCPKFHYKNLKKVERTSWTTMQPLSKFK